MFSTAKRSSLQPQGQGDPRRAAATRFSQHQRALSEMRDFRSKQIEDNSKQGVDKRVEKHLDKYLIVSAPPSEDLAAQRYSLIQQYKDTQALQK